MKTYSREIIILVVFFCIGFSRTATKSFCDPGWNYHNETQTCLRVIHYRDNFNSANGHCKSYSGGPYKMTQGHLVYILNRETDEYVKQILAKEHVSKAFIGLFYQTETGQYQWGDNASKSQPAQPVPATYFGWNSSSLDADVKGSVVITPNGWEHWSGYAGYVCQVGAAMSLPALECLPALQGEKGHLRCSINLDGQLSWSALSLTSKGPVANCTGYMQCKAEPGFNANILTSRKKNEVIMSLEIDNVTSNEGIWTCNIQFKGHVKSVKGQQCNLQVYFAPEDPHCSYNLTDSSISVSCVTDKVNPHARCEWTYNYTRDVQKTNYNGNRIDPQHFESNGFSERYRGDFHPTDEDEETHSFVVKDDGVFFSTECKKSFHFYHFLNPGVHNISLTMFPDVPGQNLSRSTFARTKQIVVNVTLPQERPMFHRSDNSTINWEYKVTEKETVQIKCVVLGGSPPVYATSIFCDEEILGTNGQGLITATGQEVMMEITVTRKMHLGTCRCKALHVTGLYNLEGGIIFNVTFPPEVSPPIFNRSQYGTEVIVESGQLVRAECFVIGNPTSSVSLYSIDKDKEHMLKTVRKNYLDYSFTAFCKDTGTYSCVTSVTDNQNETQVKISASTVLKVRCRPQLCESPDSQLNVGIALSDTVSFTLCIMAFPAPNSFMLAATETLLPLPPSRFSATFTYTEEERSLANITITIKNFTFRDIGEYTLSAVYVKNGDCNGTNCSDINFRLILKDPGDEILLDASSNNNNGLSDTDLIAIIVPIVVVIIVIIIITVIVVIIVKKRRARSLQVEQMSYRLTDC